MNHDIVIVDLETTGLVPGQHEIIELGFIYCVLRDGQLVKVDSFHSYVRPYHKSRVEDDAMSVNKIPWETLENAPTPTEVRSNLERWWESCVSTQAIHAGQNPGFDKAFLIRFLGQETYDKFFEYWTLDSKSMAWAQQVAGHIPEEESLSLDQLMMHYDVYEKPHSALGDTWTTMAIMNKMIGNQ